MRGVWCGVALVLGSTGAMAQSWQATAPGVADIPAAESGLEVAGARIACAGDVWSMRLGDGAGTMTGAVALVVDGSVFPTVVNGDGAIEISAAMIEAMKAGNRLTVTRPEEGGTAQVVFGLRGSRAALDAAAESCAPAEAAEAPVTDMAATLGVAGAILAAATISVQWTGPNQTNDWVGFAQVGSPGSSWVGVSYAYTSAGMPAQVIVPDQPGEYELRYVSGADSAVLASMTVTVGGEAPVLPVVTLAAVGAKAGDMLRIELPADAPRAGGDYLYISAAGSGDGDYSGGYATVPVEGPVEIQAPATAGEWELRYVVTRNGQYIVVGRAPLTLE